MVCYSISSHLSFSIYSSSKACCFRNKQEDVMLTIDEGERNGS